MSGAQLYQPPVYPQHYFRWCTELKPDIVANMGELRNNHWHMGLDVRTNQVVNQRVVAAADGYIAFVGIEPLSWGRWIIINHPNGLSSLYGHLNNFRPDLEKYVTEQQYKNQSWETHLDIPAGRFPVKKGDFISYSGTTGGSGGPHVHFEVIDTHTGIRLNPSLFGIPIADDRPPTLVQLAMYDRGNSVFDQSPKMFRLSKHQEGYSVSGGRIRTNFDRLSFAIQAYDTRNGTTNQDGIYSARLFVDDRELSSFYIDSVSYSDTRYMNAQIDYRAHSISGSWLQHTTALPGDRSGVYHDLGEKALIRLEDTLVHEVRIEVRDTRGNLSVIRFDLQQDGSQPPVARNYDWIPNRPNKLFREAFEAYLPVNALYDRMNTGYAAKASVALNAVSAKHQLGAASIPVHANFEVRIKPDRPISASDRDKILIKRTVKNTSVRKAEWRGDWLTAQFRDFGSFEAVIDNVPPVIPSLGSGSVVDLSKSRRISLTPKDNYGIASFRAELDGKWLRFTNDKGRTWVYYFDDRVSSGKHTLTVTVTDIAGNIARKSWTFIR
ncbi:M23 family metallopeptidase [Niabella terrae]